MSGSEPVVQTPANAELAFSRGNARFKAREYVAAIAHYDEAIAARPGYAEAWFNRGNALRCLGHNAEAVANFDAAAALRPDFAPAHYNRGNAQRALGQHEAAVASYDAALALRPDFANAHHNRGNALRELGRHAAAVASHDRALALDPDRADVHESRAVALLEMGLFAAAAAAFERAVALNPDSAEAHIGSGNALFALKRHAAAVASFDAAIALEPGHAVAYNNRGNALTALGQFAAAVASFDRAAEFDAGLQGLQGARHYARMQICDWRDFEAELAALHAATLRGEAAANPFCLLGSSNSPSLQRRAAENWVRAELRTRAGRPRVRRRAATERIRVGYFSPDFRLHPVSILTAELFELHDRSRVEITAFSFGHHARDRMRERLEAAFDRFIDVRESADAEVVRLARELEIDIAVDLAGFTQDARPGIFVRRAAPIQAAYIGYLGTLGSRCIDYLFADATIVPAAHRRHYAEKIACLPCYQANDSQRRIGTREFSRAELHLPATGFVFCCFNALYKIVPDTFSVWMRILRRVEGSVLLLCADGAAAEDNLRGEARRRGVDPDRIIFAARLPFADYLARYRAADLFLDTLPYNAGATASDALWAGLPVLTCIGETFAGRVAASVVNAIGLAEELVAENPVRYEDMAVELAASPPLLCGIRRKLVENRLSAPLFDTPAFARHLETAYGIMISRYRNRLGPAHFEVRSAA